MAVWAISLRQNFAQAREDVCQFVEFDLFSSQSPSRDVCGSELLSYRRSRGTRELGLGTNLPQDRRTVVAEGKDHIQADPSTITACAVRFVG